MYMCTYVHTLGTYVCKWYCMSHLHVMSVSKQVPDKGVEGIHGFLEQVATQSPNVGEEEQRAEEGVEGGWLGSQVHGRVGLEEQRVHQATQGADLTDLHLRRGDHQRMMRGLVTYCMYSVYVCMK